MKKLLSVLLVSILLIGCSENRVLINDLTNKGKSRDILMYYESVLFNGIGFNIYSNGQLWFEGNFKDGKEDGVHKFWYKNGQLKSESNHIDGKREGLSKVWYSNGQLSTEGNYYNDTRDGVFKEWYENGQLESESTYFEGERMD